MKECKSKNVHDEEILTWSISLHTTQIETDTTREADQGSSFSNHTTSPSFITHHILVYSAAALNA